MTDQPAIKSTLPPFHAGGRMWLATQVIGNAQKTGRWVLAVEQDAVSPAPVHLVWMPNAP